MTEDMSPDQAAVRRTAATSDGPELLVMPPRQTSAAERLREVAAALPDQVAITTGDLDVSYADLQHRVQALTAELVPLLAGDAGVTPADARQPVGIYAEQGVDSVAAMFAVMATGHACVVLDVLLPPARAAVIVERAGVGVVLADAERRDAAAAMPGVHTVRDLAMPDGAQGGAQVEVPVAPALDDPATLVFTSGTTGLPKGVVWTQRTVLACGQTSRETLRITPADRVSLALPQGFAVGQLSVVAALLNGATLCVRDPRVHGIHDLAAWVEATGVTVLNCTPSLLRSLHGALPEGHVLPALRLVTTAGEKVYGTDVSDFRQHLPAGASFMNWMGSSETEALTSFEIRPGDPVPSGAVPIGTAIPLRTLSVLGPTDEPVQPGEVGVLHATSEYFSAGYWRDPAATATRFRVEPDGRTRYCTGDRARMDADGVVEILGRGDDSVKIRGYLVEPAEVESALRALPDVVDAVVRGTGTDEHVRLVAWVVPDPHRPEPTAQGLRRDVGQQLPEWMVPRDVVLLPELPRNERGKVDVGALPAPAERHEGAAPATDTERAVEQVWAPILGVEHVGREESFTALGGESLDVEEMFTALSREFGVSLVIDDLAAHPTLAEFAALLTEKQAEAAQQGSGGTVGRLLRRLGRGGARR
ncbi:non-ribosomal peptide synthetase [Modestobacter italicus]|nr:non-ribosomal peptide synthetase [Modestobacter marinus]